MLDLSEVRFMDTSSLRVLEQARGNAHRRRRIADPAEPVPSGATTYRSSTIEGTLQRSLRLSRGSAATSKQCSASWKVVPIRLKDPTESRKESGLQARVSPHTSGRRPLPEHSSSIESLPSLILPFLWKTSEHVAHQPAICDSGWSPAEMRVLGRSCLAGLRVARCGASGICRATSWCSDRFLMWSSLRWPRWYRR